MSAETEVRIERDSLGEVRVPAGALYGAQTQRAVENFPISDERFPPVFIRALGLIKGAAAEVNLGLGLLDEEKAQAIVQAAQARADQILADTGAEIEQTRQEADRYVIDTLTHLEMELERFLNQVRNGIRTLQEEIPKDEQ